MNRVGNQRERVRDIAITELYRDKDDVQQRADREGPAVIDRHMAMPVRMSVIVPVVMAAMHIPPLVGLSRILCRDPSP